MPRLPYKPEDTAEPQDLISAMRTRRGGHLLHLDRMLIYSPAFAKGWNAFLSTVRGELDLPAKFRELAICVVAVANEANYEFHHHAPELAAAGATPAQIEALAVPQAASSNTELFDQAERAVIDLALALTCNVRVDDAIFDAAASALNSEQRLVELIGVIACYNMVSRFLVAFEIQPE